MKAFIKALDRRTIVIFFAALYGVALVFALFPPLYLWASGMRVEILGIPFALAYWIIDAFVLGVTLTAFYVVESIRGELDDDSTELLTETIGG